MGGRLLVIGSNYGVAVGMEGAALLRTSVLAIGPELSAEAKPSSGGYLRYAAGVQAGFVFAIGDDVDLDCLGSAGAAYYDGVGSGSGWFAPGASGGLPYVGARTGLSFTLRRERRATIQLGVWAIYTNEIGRTPATVYTNCGLFNCEGQHTVNIGGARYGGAVGLVVNLR